MAENEELDEFSIEILSFDIGRRNMAFARLIIQKDPTKRKRERPGIDYMPSYEIIDLNLTDLGLEKSSPVALRATRLRTYVNDTLSDASPNVITIERQFTDSRSPGRRNYFAWSLSLILMGIMAERFPDATIALVSPLLARYKLKSSKYAKKQEMRRRGLRLIIADEYWSEYILSLSTQTDVCEAFMMAIQALRLV